MRLEADNTVISRPWRTWINFAQEAVQVIEQIRISATHNKDLQVANKNKSEASPSNRGELATHAKLPVSIQSFEVKKEVAKKTTAVKKTSVPKKSTTVKKELRQQTVRLDKKIANKK
jgi:hypothetical protein